MKITKDYLKRLIKEEMNKSLREQEEEHPFLKRLKGKFEHLYNFIGRDYHDKIIKAADLREKNKGVGGLKDTRLLDEDIPEILNTALDPNFEKDSQQGPRS
jgi:SPX domain protein involved in polyphosphate accumulation